MKDVLVQSQIDALLQEFSGGTIEIGDIAEQRKIKDYDFRIPKKFTKEQLRTIVGIYEMYARQLSSYLTGSLRTDCKLEVVSIEETRYYEYSNAIPELTLLGILEMGEQPGTVVMSLSNELVFTIIDKLLGGSGTGGESGREYTDIEMVLMERFYKNIISYLKDAWSGIDVVTPQFRKFEVDNSANIMPVDEIVVVLVINITIKELTGKMTVCLPFMWLESIYDKLFTKYRISDRAEKVESEETKQLLLSQVYQTMIELSVDLGSCKISVGDFMNLEVGDVIRLDQKIDDYVVVKMGNKPWYYGKLGVKNHKKAVKIISEV